MSFLLQEIFLKPSHEIKRERFLAQETELAFAPCSGKCRSPGGCIVLLSNEEQ